MSSYGVAFVVEVPQGSSWVTGLVGYEDEPRSDGWACAQGCVDLDDEAVEQVREQLAITGGRAAVAEDRDDYGACFEVLEGRGGTLATVYRAFVLNADPEDADEVEAALGEYESDPRAEDVTGKQAAQAAAGLFGVDPTAMVEADATYRDTAWEELGVVGGPFPWWPALGLDWPTT